MTRVDVISTKAELDPAGIFVMAMGYQIPACAGMTPGEGGNGSESGAAQAVR